MSRWTVRSRTDQPAHRLGVRHPASSSPSSTVSSRARPRPPRTSTSSLVPVTRMLLSPVRSLRTPCPAVGSSDARPPGNSSVEPMPPRTSRHAAAVLDRHRRRSWRGRRAGRAWVALPDPQAAVDLVGVVRESAGDRLTAFELMSRQSVEIVLRHGAGARDPIADASPWYALVELSDTLPDAGLDA